jgi:alpha,alpha-trehalose phosphorylase (configuration-retaining)
MGDFIIERLREYSEEHDERFTGIGMPEDVANRYPQLCSRLWHELDIVPIAFPEGVPLFSSFQHTDPTKWDTRAIDELAEAMSRRCVRCV